MSKRKVESLCKKFNATMDINRSRPLDVCVDAPDGYTWQSDPGLHAFVGSQWPGETAASVWADLAERMEWGIEKCDCVECKAIKEILCKS